MRTYRLLVVDDEPHVIDTIVSLLEAQIDLSLDIYYAYSGRQAVEIMEKGKIDLLITDIQMPDITGIKLVDTVNRLWPICKIVFLTAHSDFSYAYEAIRKHVVSYILKSEDDEYIVSEIRKAIKAIEEELDQNQALTRSGFMSARKRPPVNKDLFFHILSRPDLPEEQLLPLFSILGFREPFDAFYLIQGIIKHPSESGGQADVDVAFAVQDIFNLNMGLFFTHSVCESDEDGSLIWIASPQKGPHSDNPAVRLSGMLETVQSSCLMTAGVNISFILSAQISDAGRIPSIYTAMKKQAWLKADDNEPFIFTFSREQENDGVSHTQDDKDLAGNTIKFIKDYIASHITEDISLMQLSTVTGYNSSYISDLFHKGTGEKLSRYITGKKLKMIENLLKKQDLTIEMVCRQAGFGSRQYFNYFIKKETNLSPKKYRIKILNQNKKSG